jgi:enoyl-CoA hydratase/carnithine racemase
MDASEPVLTVERQEDVTRLTLNRPDKRNALSAELVEALLRAVAVASDDGTRLLVVQGNGQSFCAGFDFGGIEQQSDADLVLRFLRVEQLLQAVHHAPCATLALAQGPCFGAGADLVAACMHRVGTPTSRFRMPGLHFGVVLGTRRLARLVGTDAARSLLETTRVFDAGEAMALGFLTAVDDQHRWPGVAQQLGDAARTLPEAAQRAMLAHTGGDTRDADLAALARSVADPGLRDRIVAFLQQARTP